MRRILILTLMTTILSLFLAACGPQDEIVLPTRAAVAEIDQSSGQTDAGETAVQPEESETVVNQDLPSLPSLAAAPAGAAGLGGGLDSNVTIAEGDVAEDTSMLAPDAGNLLANATFTLGATLPTDVTEAQVWQQPIASLDVERARMIAERWGVSDPLYILALPDESVLSEPIGLEAAPLPANVPEFHAFDGAKSIVMTESSAYFIDDSVPFDYETPRPFADNAPAAEAVLQSMGLLDFPYVLADGWGHEVWVNRVIDGIETNYAEISAGVNENGRLAFASYQPLDQLITLGAYPLIPAETAWQRIQDGIDEEILFTITPQIDETEIAPEALPSGFQYWPREHQPGQEVHFYTVPTVFLPVQEGLPPLIKALNYTVQTDDDTRQALADQLGVNVHFWGVLDTAANTLALTGWEALPELNPLIKNGIVQRQGEQTLLVDAEGGTFILPDAPVDLADGSLVNVFSWATRDAGQAYPVLDWEGIDTQIAEGSGETMALPEVMPPAAPVYNQISINDVTLAYYAYPEFKETKDGRFHQTFLLLPVWQFSGLADNGDTLQFTVKATAE